MPLTPGIDPRDAAPIRPGRPAAALRAVIRTQYDTAAFRADVMAGLVVGLVALPLSMALAIASGVPPQHGLYTAIVAGALTAVLGGSRVQVTGPTAAFVAVLVPVSAHFGLGGLLLATLMAGVLLVLLGVSGMGRLVEFVPFPVTTGFTAGIAVVIATLQLPDFLGLTVTYMPEQYLSKLGALLAALPTMRPTESAVGAVTLAVLIVWPRWSRRIPAPLVAIVGGVFAYVLALAGSDLEVPTIHSRFTYEVHGVTHAGIPRMPPQPVLPWRMPGPDGQPLVLGFALIRALAPAAFAMAEVSGTRLIGPEHPELDIPPPRGVLLYEIAGPLFFGAAQKALAAITVMERREVRTVVLDLRSVPALDATGLVALESLIKRMNAKGVKVILAGVQPQPMRVLARAGWRNRRGFLRIFRSFDRAIALARHFAPGTSVSYQKSG